MSFSTEIKEEIIKKGVGGKCCKKAFLAGFIRSTGSIIKTEDGYGFECSTDMPNAMGYTLRLLKEIYSYEGGETFFDEDNLNKRYHYTADCIGPEAVDILFDLGILGYGEEGDEYELRLKSNKELLKKECCVKAFIKGMFIGSGSCTIPEQIGSTTGYHLEVVFTHKVPAGEFAGHLASFNILAKTISRRKNTVVYVKSSDEIKDFLALINAPMAVLKITDTMIEKQMSNDANRKRNCDLANVSKSIVANEKYAQSILLIDTTIGIETLSNELQTVADMRLKYPEDTLSELAERLGITKSCLNHRLRKINKIAEELE